MLPLRDTTVDTTDGSQTDRCVNEQSKADKPHKRESKQYYPTFHTYESKCL